MATKVLEGKVGNGTARNEQATCVMEAYLRAAGISYSPLPGGVIAVTTSEGGELHIVFGQEPAPPRSQKYPTVTLNPEAILTTKKDTAMSVFHRITEMAGYGRPVPVERGPEPVGPVNDFFLVSIRHRDFRMVPNPPEEDLRAHEKLINEVCRSFFHDFKWLCLKKGYDVGDLRSLALSWTTIFLGKYRRTRRPQHENEKLLRRHLEQRLFGEFSLRLQRDLRIDYIDPETYNVATTGDVEGLRNPREYMGPFKTKTRMPELDLSNDDARRKSARALLVDKLTKMPHGDLVTMLTEASLNQALCHDTRAEARRRLLLHRKKCATCSKTPAPAPAAAVVMPEAELGPRPTILEMDEDVAGVDRGSDEE